jgi:hypothetical protein
MSRGWFDDGINTCLCKISPFPSLHVFFNYFFIAFCLMFAFFSLHFPAPVASATLRFVDARRPYHERKDGEQLHQEVAGPKFHIHPVPTLTLSPEYVFVKHKYTKIRLRKSEILTPGRLI